MTRADVPGSAALPPADDPGEFYFAVVSNWRGLVRRDDGDVAEPQS